MLWIKRFLCLSLFCSLVFGSVAAEEATYETAQQSALPASEDGPDESLLQQGLTIHEIDKEVGRLRQEEKNVQIEIGENEDALVIQQEALDKKSDAAGKVLRAYYMGNRDHLWLLLFKMDSMTDLLTALDYLNSVVRNDFRVLHAYKAAYEERVRLLADLEVKKGKLQAVIADYLSQRERLVALQEELDRKLAHLSEQERERQTEQIKQLNSDWEKEGLPLFKKYLAELSVAMKDISELLSDESKLSLDGTNIIVRLTEKDFNDFLQSKSPLFKAVSFVFTEDKLIISGETEGSKKASIQGRYVLEEEPMNQLRFQILKLDFNGFTLPETTNRALEEQFDLTFQPSLLIAGLKVTDFKTKDGLLEVGLSFDGFPLALGSD